MLTFAPTLDYVSGLNVPDYYSYLYIILISIPAFYVVYRGIKLSYRSQMVANIMQIIFVISISIIIILSSPRIGFAPFTAYNIGIKGVFLGFITGSYLSFAGFGSIVPLGEEAKAPHKSIGTSVMLIILIMGGIYLLGSYAMVAGWGINSIATFSQSIYPGFIIVSKYGKMPNYIFFILNFFVVYPLFVTMATALSRNIYAMAKDGILPLNFSKTHEKYKSPHIAVLYIVIIFSIVSFVSSIIFYYYEMGFFNGFFYDFLFFASLSTIITLIMHMFVNFSLYSKFKFEKSYNIGKILTHIVLPTISTIITILAVYYAIISLTFPVIYAPIIILIYSLLIIIIYMVFRKNNISINVEGDIYE